MRDLKLACHVIMFGKGYLSSHPRDRQSSGIELLGEGSNRDEEKQVLGDSACQKNCTPTVEVHYCQWTSVGNCVFGL